jgi:voltage-gated potassium channel Kch/Ca2+-binding EF-hand superfamily protein
MGQYTDFLGLSATTGAFAAGVLLAGNRYRAQIQADIKPFEGILLGVFFMTAGAQLDPNVVIEEWPTLLTGILAFIVTKAVIVFASGPTLGLTKGQAARVAVTLSGGGEFAFVLFTLAKSLGVLPTDLAKLLTASVIISMSLTPLLAEAGALLGNYFDNTSGDQLERSLSLAEANDLFDGIDEDKSGFIDIDELGKALSREGFNYATIAEVFDQFDTNRDGVISREEWKLGLETGLLNEALALDRNIPEADVDFRQDAIVICGYGEVGKSLFETIQSTGKVKEGGIVVFDLNPTRVTAGVLQGAPVVFGDPARLDLMRAAGVKNPKAVIVTYASDSRRVEATSRLRNALPSTTPIFAMEGANHVTQQLLDAGATTVISQTTETVLRFTSLLGIVSEPEDLTRLRESFRTKELKAATNGEVNEFEERHRGMNKLQFLDLASEVGCTRAELEQLYDEFYSVSIDDNDTVAIKDLKEMIMRMTTIGPSDGTALDRCMNFKDEDGSGELTFEEFVRAYFDDTCEVGFESSRVSSVATGPLVEPSTPITTFREQP